MISKIYFCTLRQHIDVPTALCIDKKERTLLIELEKQFDPKKSKKQGAKMNYLDHLIRSHPMRRREDEKEAFRRYVLEEAGAKGHKAEVELTNDQIHESKKIK